MMVSVLETHTVLYNYFLLTLLIHFTYYYKDHDYERPASKSQKDITKLN